MTPTVLQRGWRARRRGLSCQELVELVTDYLEGSLSARERRRFEQHISGCPHCTVYLEDLRITLRVLGSLGEEDVTGDMREELLDVFRDWRAGASPPGPASGPPPD